MVVTKYKLLEGNDLRAPFETKERVAAYRLENQEAINAYNAKVAYAKPVSRDTPVNLSTLGSMLVGDQFEIQTPKKESKLSKFASSLLDTQALKSMRVKFA